MQEPTGRELVRLEMLCNHLHIRLSAPLLLSGNAALDECSALEYSGVIQESVDYFKWQ